jgi:hypothetical protein
VQAVLPKGEPSQTLLAPRAELNRPDEAAGSRCSPAFKGRKPLPDPPPPPPAGEGLTASDGAF